MADEQVQIMRKSWISTMVVMAHPEYMVKNPDILKEVPSCSGSMGSKIEPDAWDR